MKSVSELLHSRLTPLDVIEPIGHALIDKAEAEAHGVAQLIEPEAVVMVLWQFIGVAMNDSSQAAQSTLASAVYLALHRIGESAMAAAFIQGTPGFFSKYEEAIVAALLNYMRLNQHSINPEGTN